MALDVPLAGSRSVAAQNAGDTVGKRHRRRDSSTLTVSRISTHAEALAIFDAWRELYVLGAPQNPFASPDWLLPWARHFVPERNLAMLTVRRRGQLVGVAPWYVKRGPLGVSRLQLLGIDKGEEFTELP